MSEDDQWQATETGPIHDEARHADENGEEEDRARKDHGDEDRSRRA